MKNRKAKGFTLVEVIVALGVFMVMSLVLATAITYTANLTYKNQNIVNKINFQSGYGAVEAQSAIAVDANAKASDSSIKFDSVEIYMQEYEIEGNGTNTSNDKYGDEYGQAPNMHFTVPTA